MPCPLAKMTTVGNLVDEQQQQQRQRHVTQCRESMHTKFVLNRRAQAIDNEE
jgi:hypothetical protein